MKEHGREVLLSTITEAIRSSTVATGPCALRGTARVHVLFSTPSSAKELYPFAHVDPQSSKPPPKPLDAFVEHVFCTRAAVLYVSKVDSTGWAPRAVDANLVDFVQGFEKQSSNAVHPKSQPTSLVRLTTTAFLSHFASLRHWETKHAPITHCSIHVLARSQGAYLFPSSPENPLKRVLPDGKLIAWWRQVLSDVNASTGYKGRNFYIVPGYDNGTARELLPAAPIGEDDALSRSKWVYGHPYTRGLQQSPPLPLHRKSTDGRSDAERIHNGLRSHGSPATLMPHFPDDPKSRFISELARDAHELASGPETASTSEAGDDDDESDRASKRARLEDSNTAAHGERLPTETSQAATHAPAHSLAMSTRQPTAPFKSLFKERAALDAISPDEFWERMGFRQECCAGNAVGVFVCIFEVYEAGEDSKREEKTAVHQHCGSTALSPQALALPPKVLSDVIFRHLLRDVCDWSNWDMTKDLTKAWHDAVLRAVLRKGGLSQTKDKGSGAVAEHASPQLDDSLPAVQVAKGVLWSDIACAGPTKAQLMRAKEDWEKAGRPLPRAIREEQEKKSKVVVNTLNVKRKKKP
ncbi:HISTONE ACETYLTRANSFERASE RTT109 [Ceraceosorus bombacis]|uniref:histone acetyltransferase n=1 Tax=Ceraceosorus bombacis TaxID=401625 RepID=A0A0P1BG04_9BASI|nr:HISTONE ACETYLTRANSFERASE RTT109 [Ceraceosorus bombacis]